MSKAKRKQSERIEIEKCHLYGFTSPHALALRLGWPLQKLRELAENGQYREFNHKTTGRAIQEPGAALQSLHRQIRKYLARIEVPEYLHSAVKGRSYLSNASHHVGDGALVKIDIKKFYDSTPQYKVMHFFRDSLNCSPDVAGLLANLVCFRGKLATGSSVSPIISYYTYKPLFDSLAALADRNGLKMTCYVDDITFSGHAASKKVLHEARTLIFRAGLRAHKARAFPKDHVRIVTGVAVGELGISLPFSRWQKIHAASREIRDATTDDQRAKLYPKLVSRLYEAAQIDPLCRPRAEYHHAQWRALKKRLAASPPSAEAIAA